MSTPRADNEQTMFSVESNRIDPYANFKFRIKLGESASPVAGLSKMSALKLSTELVEWREAGDPARTHKLPSFTKYEPVTIERGLSENREFIEWVTSVVNPTGLSAAALPTYRRNVTIELHDLDGKPVMRFGLKRAWPSEFQASSDLDANANAIVIQTLRLEHEGLELETLVTQTDETDQTDKEDSP